MADPADVELQHQPHGTTAALLSAPAPAVARTRRLKLAAAAVAAVAVVGLALGLGIGLGTRPAGAGAPPPPASSSSLRAAAPPPATANSTVTFSSDVSIPFEVTSNLQLPAGQNCSTLFTAQGVGAFKASVRGAFASALSSLAPSSVAVTSLACDGTVYYGSAAPSAARRLSGQLTGAGEDRWHRHRRQLLQGAASNNNNNNNVAVVVETGLVVLLQKTSALTLATPIAHTTTPAAAAAQAQQVEQLRAAFVAQVEAARQQAAANITAATDAAMAAAEQGAFPGLLLSQGASQQHLVTVQQPAQRQQVTAVLTTPEGVSSPLALEGTPPSPPPPPPTAPDDPWMLLPPGSTSPYAPVSKGGLLFNFQLSDPFLYPKHLLEGVKVYVIDWTTPKMTVSALRNSGYYPIAYFSVGAYTPNDPDAPAFQRSDLGNTIAALAHENQAYLNWSSANVRSIMAARLDVARAKGFVGVHFDGQDFWSRDAFPAWGHQPTGLNLTADVAVDYLKFLAAETHRRSMGWGMLNNQLLFSRLKDVSDWFINESCYMYEQYGDCEFYRGLGKAVYQLNYNADDFGQRACNASNLAAFGMVSVLKTPLLARCPLSTCDKVLC